MLQRQKLAIARMQEAEEKPRLFGEGDLLMLREMAARFYAERIARDVQDWRQITNVQGPAKSSHRILVAVEAGMDSEQVILWTRRLAGSLNSSWIVLCASNFARASRLEVAARLNRNLELARELGAEVITTADEDFPDAVLRVAFSRNITQIVVGKPSPAPWWRLFPHGLPQPGSFAEAGNRRAYRPGRSRNIAPAIAPKPRGSDGVAIRVVVATVRGDSLCGFLFTHQWSLMQWRSYRCWPW